MHLFSLFLEGMVYETLTQITPRRCKQYLPSLPWGEMGGRNARIYPQILVKTQKSMALSRITNA
jgi:hypothetical protein